MHVPFPSKCNYLVSGQSKNVNCTVHFKCMHIRFILLYSTIVSTFHYQHFSGQSGKTFWIKRLLLHNEQMFEEVPIRIIYCFRHWQKLYDEIQAALSSKVLFLAQIPTEDELIGLLSQEQDSLQLTDSRHVVLVVDDYMDRICTDPLFLSLLTRIGHYYCLSNIFLVQDGSLHGPMKRELLSNIHTNVFMANARDRAMLRSLAISLNDYQTILQSYDDCATGGRGSYLVICTHPASDPALKYRTNIFPDDEIGTVIYRSRKAACKRK